MRSVLLICLFTTVVHADVRLPAVISDHMVVQADQTVTIWGWADANEIISVEFVDQVKAIKADAEGKWSVKLDPMNARRESLTLTVRGAHAITVRDVLIGEVWLASGQSNMEMTIKDKLHGSVDNADAEIAAAAYPQIRMFLHDSHYSIYDVVSPSDSPLPDRSGKWVVCSPETARDFSAIGYFFARDLVNDLQKPVGILSASVGGTPIEAWTSLSSQQAVPELQPMLEDWAKRLNDFVPEREQKKLLDAKAIWLKQRSAAIKAANLPRRPRCHSRIFWS